MLVVSGDASTMERISIPLAIAVLGAGADTGWQSLLLMGAWLTFRYQQSSRREDGGYGERTTKGPTSTASSSAIL